ncbi:hypothetical protein EPUS_06863 [Endocarpon pusillum Z07020]|uniref:Peroxidase n=1 Tax=Endocarpon pusillum (strain Z07020 / HMAS-L-300199) TaxID=1263415 RepID=U1I168_ENDPU|nr:uncharacterized protein EPUS_06863 [Endocarpon pusillum Z07020]ERF76995.1 hypothetical protein EPUS_06863 [Endocarpon pusillum Z07020]
MAANDKAANIQALADRGFSSLTGACYLLLRIKKRALAKPWLRTLDIASLTQAPTQHLPQVCQIAFTAAGLCALSTKVTLRAGFDRQRTPLASARRRRRQCPCPLAQGHRLAQATCSAAQAASCMVISGNTLTTTTTPLSRKPFGFADSVSQPNYNWDGTLTPGGARDRDYRNLLAMGELLLGYPNEYGFISDYPHADELGRNGSYLVYRQLAQDVAGFWQWLACQAGDGMVGHMLDGAPLPGLESATIMGTDDPRNAFLFGEDRNGCVCPIGAHIRRVNPRSSDDPEGRHGFLRDLISSVGFSGASTACPAAVAPTAL